MRRLAALVLVCFAPGIAGAQKLTGSIGAIGGAVRTRSIVGTTSEVAAGGVIGAEGNIGVGRVTIDVSYLQGSLNPEVVGATTRDYVEGDAYLSLVTFPGIVLRGGPHARAYISEAGTQRWLFWTGHLRGEFNLIASPVINAFAEVWVAFSADVNVSEEFDDARGAIVGMTARIPGSAFYGRLSYAVEHAGLGDGARVENVEGLSVVVGFGRR